jgi:hypothetical protein
MGGTDGTYGTKFDGTSTAMVSVLNGTFFKTLKNNFCTFLDKFCLIFFSFFFVNCALWSTGVQNVKTD